MKLFLTGIFYLYVFFLSAAAAQAQSPDPLPTALPELAGGVSDKVDYVNGSTPNTKIVRPLDERKPTVIDWQSFNVGKDAAIIFESQNKSHITVNRVIGGNSSGSRIHGGLSADGIVVILDPNGVVFSDTAVIDVGGIVASTGQLANQPAFEDGAAMVLTDLNAVAGARVRNDATSFTVADAGLAAFVAPSVQNNGVISARLGRVTLASGAAATLDFYGDRLIQITAALPQGQAQIDNQGKIMASGGTVHMTVRAAAATIDNAINSDGLVVATHATEHKGKIVLSDGTTKRRLKNAVRVGANAKIQDGIDAAADNTTVYVNGGHYAENLLITKPLTLTSFDTAIPVAVLSRNNDAAAISIYAPDVKIDGLRLLNGLHGIYAENAEDLKVVNSSITNSASHGIYLRNSNPAHDFENGADNIFGSNIGGKPVFIAGSNATAGTAPDNTRIFNTPAFGGFAAAPLVIEQVAINPAALAALSPAAGNEEDNNHCAAGSSCNGTTDGGKGGN